MYERVEGFLESLRQVENRSEHTIAAYRNDLTQFLNFASEEGVGDWEMVRRETIVNYQFFLREREYASSTVARKMAAVNSFFHHLVQHGEIQDDPTATVTSPRVKKNTPKSLSMAEVERLLAEPAKDGSAKGLRDQAMLEILYATGLRVSELVALEVADIDLDKRTVSCGSRSGERTVPMTPRALDALVRYLEQGRPQLLRTGEESTLFLNMRGSRLTRQGLWLIIRAYVQQAGIQAQVTPHTLRHSFAIHQLRDGVELSEVQELLGHASISTTLVYTQVQPERTAQE